MSVPYKPILDPVYNFSSSCSRDEAVDYLLGRKQSGVLHENLIPDDALPDEIELYDFSWKTLLTTEREYAESAYTNALNNKESDEYIADKLNILHHCDSQLRKAIQFLYDIDDELSKGDISELRIDQLSTTSPRLPQITLSSLNAWAIKKYGINIYNPLTPPSINNTPESTQQKNTSSAEYKELSKTRSQNLQIIFALLVEEYAKTATKYHHHDGKPNVSSIAEALDDRYPKTEKRKKFESIKSAIEEAIKVKSKFS